MDPDLRSAAPLVAERAFALLVAQNFANAVWKEVYGSSLVLENQFPRNAAQRDQLLELTRVFVRGTKWNGAFSLQALLRDTPWRPSSTQARTAIAPRACSTRSPCPTRAIREGPDRLHILPAAETCDGTTPSYRSCVRQIMTAGGVLSLPRRLGGRAALCVR